MRSKTSRPYILALLLLALVLALPTARGSDEEEPSPADRFIAAAATLPAPDAKHGFSYEGDMLMAGNPIGKMSLTAKPTDDGKGWSMTESMSFMGGAYVRNATLTTDARLAPLSGTVEGKEPDVEGFKISWEKTKSGFKFTTAVTKAGETEVTEKQVAQEGVTMHTLSALILFVRMSPPGEAAFEVTDFKPDPDEGDEMFEAASWTQDADGMHEERPVLLLEGKKGSDKLLRARFEPKDRSLISFVLKKPSDGMSMEFKVGQDAAETKPDPLKGPAKTAKAAAMQAALAFATADMEMVERLFHWPTLYDDAKVQHELATAGNPDAEPFPDAKTFKADFLEQVKAALAARQGQMPPRPMLEAGIKMVEDQLVTEKTADGHTSVKFPAMFQNLEFVVGEFGGLWKVVRMPSR